MMFHTVYIRDGQQGTVDSQLHSCAYVVTYDDVQ